MIQNRLAAKAIQEMVSLAGVPSIDPEETGVWKNGVNKLNRENCMKIDVTKQEIVTVIDALCFSAQSLRIIGEGMKDGDMNKQMILDNKDRVMKALDMLKGITEED